MKFDMLGIEVHDMAESIRFYRLLGWDIPDPEPGHPYHEITLDSGLRISWNDVEMAKGIDAAWEPGAGHRLGMAFKSDSPAEVDERYAEILAAGFQGHLPPWDAFWGQRYAIVKDPDGNLVDLFAQVG